MLDDSKAAEEIEEETKAKKQTEGRVSFVVPGLASTGSESRAALTLPPALAGSGASPAAAGTPLAGSVVATAAAALAAAGADDERERDVKVLKKVHEPDIDKKEGRDDNVDVVADDAGCQPGAATTTTMRAVSPTMPAVSPTKPTSPARERVPVFEGGKVVAMTWRERGWTPGHDDVPAPPDAERDADVEALLARAGLSCVGDRGAAEPSRQQQSLG